MFSPGDSPVSRSARQADEKVPRMTVTSGRKCVESLGRFDRVGSLEKMFSACLIMDGAWYSNRCSLIWKLKGTRHGRIYCRLQVWVRRTKGIGSGLLPTPDASLATGGKVQKLDVSITGRAANGKKRQMSLADYVRRGLVPMPSGAVKGSGEGDKGVDHFRAMTAGLLFPTPTSVGDLKGGCTRGNPRLQGSTLAHTIHGIVEIPGKTSRLNPRFVLEMMGYRPDWTELPFRNGGTDRSGEREMR